MEKPYNETEVLKEKMSESALRKMRIRGWTIIIGIVVRHTIKYLLIAGFLWACEALGLYNHDLVTRIVVTLVSIHIARRIWREIRRIILLTYEDGDGIGVVECVNEIRSELEEIKRLA